MRLKLSIILLFSLVISACDWHLRGVTPLPAEFRILHLQSSASHNFNQQLRLQLEFNDVVFTQEEEDAQAALRIKPITIEKRPLALTNTGKVAEYEINVMLIASLKRNDRDSEFPIELNSRRYLKNDIDNVVGTENAEKFLILELEKDLINKLIIRLQRIAYED